MSNIFFKKNYKKNMKFFFLRIIQKYVLLLNLKTNTDIKVLFNKDVISSNILLNGVYEKELLDFNLELCKKVGKLKNFSVADIGANIGNHSLYFSNYFKKVYAFEAHPKIFSVNQLNTSNKKNIELFNFGLGDTNKNSFIYENEHIFVINMFFAYLYMRMYRFFISITIYFAYFNISVYYLH